MTTMIIQHEVSDYLKWRAAYDGAAGLRTKHGCTGARVLLSNGGDTQITVLHEFATAEAAQGFIEDPELEATMKAAGVSGPPAIDVTTEA